MIYFTVEGTDITNEFDEYIDGDKVHTHLNDKNKRLAHRDDSDDSDNDGSIINYENFITKQMRVSTEPKLFPLLANGKVIDYKFDNYEPAGEQK